MFVSHLPKNAVKSLGRQAACSAHLLQIVLLAGVCCENCDISCIIALQNQVVTQCKQEVSLMQILVVRGIANLDKQKLTSEHRKNYYFVLLGKDMSRKQWRK
jgi:hypothetical protein